MIQDADRIFEVVARRMRAAGIPVLMIGGHAVNYYGFLRATQDIDFMIADPDAETVRRIMVDEGFTNVVADENVIFLSRPGSRLRVDFLKVDRETMSSLLARAITVEYFGRYTVSIPSLRDLLAMKIFALKSGGNKREHRDLADIAHLIVEHRLELEKDVLPLCRKYGTTEIYRRIHKLVKALKNDE